MDSYYNPYARLNFYLSYLRSNNEEISEGDEKAAFSIASMAEKTGIPLEIVRRDVAAMADYKLEYPLDIDNDSKMWEEFCQDKGVDIEETLESSEELMSALLQGQLDSIPLYMYTKEIGMFLSLNVDELAALQVLQKQDLDKKDKRSTRSFMIKNSYRFQTDISIIKKLQKILYAIKYDLGIKTQYSSQNGKKSLIEFVPLRVMYDSLSSVYGALAVQDGQVRVYRIDRMKDKLATFATKPNKADLKYLEHADQVWGMGFSERPVNVKVAFRNEANVWRKVEQETAYRSKAKIIKDEEKGWLYFEDTVYGMSAFRAWLYGYGSSAVALEPKELRDDIIAMLKERLAKNEI